MIERVRLAFMAHDEIEHADEPIRSDLSAAAFISGTLWTANDEFAQVERLTMLEDGSFGRHRVFAIDEFIDLPADADDEMDIEGLAIDGGYLWITGSHSATRDKPKAGEGDVEDVLGRLSEVETHPNRMFLGRIPLAADPDGLPALARTIERKRSAPERTARALKTTRKRSALLGALRKDPHLGRFIGVPAKENGFDIEGLAVGEGRVLLGLRGPVLRGWAVILELRIDEGRKNLKLGKFDGGRRYRKHFLDLAGAGIRDLCRFGSDLLILSGPTMELSGPCRIHSWRNAFDADGPAVLRRDSLPVLRDVPSGHGVDDPEGLAVVGGDHGSRLLVVYDSPADDRKFADNRAVAADLFDLSLG